MKKFIIISQLICSLFLILFVVGWLLPSQYELRIFGVLGRLQLFTIFTILEFIYLVIYYIIKKEYLKIMRNLLFLPLFLLLFIFFVFESPDSSYKVRLNNLEKELLIENRRAWLSGSSEIYQVENIFVIKLVYDVGGDDGHCPLENKDYYEIVDYQNGVEIIYEYGSGGDDTVHLYLKINDNKLYKVDSNELIPLK